LRFPTSPVSVCALLVAADIPALDVAIGIFVLWLVLVGASAGITFLLAQLRELRYGPRGSYGHGNPYDPPDPYPYYIARWRGRLFAIVALVLVLATNSNTFTVAKRAWTHDATEQAALTELQHHATQATPAASAKEIDAVEELGLPVGWSDANNPHDADQIVETVTGLFVTWLLVIALPAFRFDLLTPSERLHLKKSSSSPREIGEGP
jgi:hypothetical protein